MMHTLNSKSREAEPLTHKEQGGGVFGGTHRKRKLNFGKGRNIEFLHQNNEFKHYFSTRSWSKHRFGYHIIILLFPLQ